MLYRTYFSHIVDNKTIQNDIFPLDDTCFRFKTSIIVFYPSFKRNVDNK